MSANLKIPIALSYKTNSIINVKDVKNGLECNCYCPNCHESLVAVNQEIKQKAHFRHKSNSSCEFNNNFESYIHWLAKETFKNIGKITVPAIKSSNLKYPNRLFLQKEISNYLQKNSLPNFVNMNFEDSENYHKLYNGEILLQKATQVNISNCIIEKVFHKSHEDIRVDIVALVQSNELFIEPFFSHRIDDSKLKVIESLDVSCISINLINFVNRHKYIFSIEEFEDFLINDLESKKWEHVRKSKTKSLINNLSMNIWPKRLSNIMELIKNNDMIDQLISKNNQQISFLEQ
jgi:competence CoiA-like predicted nuclease